MAANSGSFIRVRLHFDYAPPAVIGCRMCWLLVDLRSCRVVADLESIIRDKFEFSRGSVLSLFVEDCYLPHTESVLVVRDNDCVRVKVDTVSKTKKHTSPESASENSRKRERPAEENESGESGLSLEFKKKKRKKSVGESPAVNGLQTEVEETKKTLHKKNDKKKKKQKEEKRKSTPPAALKPSPSVKKTPNSIEKVVKSTKKPQRSSSSDTSSSSEDEQPVKKTPVPNPKLVTKPALPPTTTPTAPKTITNGRPTLKKLPPPTSSSSSDSDSSSSEEAKSAKAVSTNAKSKSEDAPSNNSVQASSVIPNESSSDEEIRLVIKKPVQQPQGRIVVGQPSWQQSAGRGRGQSKPAPRELNRGRGKCIEYSYRENERHKNEASYSTDSLTNVSVVIQNQTVIESLPKPDYSSMPLLAAPPQVGQKIAFKLLELTENYTPEVSDYKEAKILGFDPSSKQIELELLTASQAPVEPGKFDLVYQNPDGSERVEYAVERESLVNERWDSLLEPRLII